MRRSWGDIGGRGGGGPSRRGRIGFYVALFESGVLALVLASCGEKPEPRLPIRPTPTSSAPLKEPDQGDEKGIKLKVAVTVTRKQMTSDPPSVAAFLPVRFVVANRSRQRISVRIPGVAPLRVAPGLTASADSQGFKPGRVPINAGKLQAILRVKRSR